MCRARGNFNNNKNNNKGSTSNKANVVQTEEIIAAVVCEAHLVTKVKGWVVDSACTSHISAFKEEFSSYTPMAEGTECVYVRDNRQVTFINAEVTVDSSKSFSKLPRTISHLLEFSLESLEGVLSINLAWILNLDIVLGKFILRSKVALYLVCGPMFGSLRKT
ncbi:hypothetical protein CMV_013612 [Castanea mollissima]|uniref:Uncharacterized protein n=1 Tax=Castanea mollissima TaxID=60419 RepID=A0A8J4VLR2_9ROSI|nr:hypothetical protein CMV_013612 [Castanea mollissima]